MAARKLTTTTNPVQRAFGYARVSTDQQADSGISLDEQRRKIEARCSENGWNLERIYVDAGVSGSTPLARRPEGAKLLAVLRPGDVVIAARMDRCFRSARSMRCGRSRTSSAARFHCGYWTWVMFPGTVCLS
jgi:DNA invertase Pin-like site-specific DNA recombinase